VSELLRGTVPEQPLLPVALYADWVRFKTWPLSTALWDLPSDTVDELRYIAGRVEQHREQQAKKEENAAAAAGRRRGPR
jgi:hypothetical protein